MSFSVISGMANKAGCKSDKYHLYLNAVSRLAKKVTLDGSLSPEVVVKLAFLGIKTVRHMPEPPIYREVALTRLDFICKTKEAIAELTPRQFMQMFPITKDYSGKRWGHKDYFYTMEFLKDYEVDKPIGMARVSEFLWEYTNRDILEFNVNCFAHLDIIRRFEGKQSLAAEWAEKVGIETYTMFHSEKRDYLLNKQTGEITRAKRRPPRYLHVIDEGVNLNG